MSGALTLTPTVAGENQPPTLLLTLNTDQTSIT